MKPYKKYKPSGIDWIKEIPEDWEVRRVKDSLSDYVYGTSEKTYSEGKFEILGMGEIKDGRISPSHKNFLNYLDKYFLLKKNDILYTRTNGSFQLIGKAGLLEKDIPFLSFASYLVRLRCNNNEIPVYYNYLFNSYSFRAKARSICISTAQNNLSSSKYTNIIIPELCRKSQTKIANYLDQKTAQTDKKINLLEQKLSKYEELKKTLINETVCRGLDKNIELKESGVEWIGKIPKHWEVKRMKDVGFIETSSVNKKIIEEERKIKLVNYIDIYNNQKREINSKKDFMIVSANEAQIRKKGLRKGDVLFTPSSETIDEIAFSAVVIEDLKQTLYSYHILRLRFNHTIVLNFKKYMFSNMVSLNRFSRLTKGTTRKILGLNDFSSFKFLLPPIIEQTQIANYLDEKCTKIDKIRATIKKKIALLKEFRKTLINDVVTGKVKVN